MSVEDLRAASAALSEAEARLFELMQKEFPEGRRIAAKLQSNHVKESKLRVERALCISGRVGYIQVRMIESGHRTAVHWSQVEGYKQ